MSRESESPAIKIIAALITAFGVIFAAILGVVGIIIQTDKPIHATQTAEARAMARQTLTALMPTIPPATPLGLTNQPTLGAVENTPQQTPATTLTSSTNYPHFIVENVLKLPVKIRIEGIYKGQVDAQSTEIFLLEHFPAVVSWEIVKETTSAGRAIGEPMSGTFRDVANGEKLFINNKVGDKTYFYPIISNLTQEDCRVVINEGLQSEYDTEAMVAAGKKNVGLGYYSLFQNSNVTLHCDGTVYWWGVREGETRGTPFNDKVEPNSGVVKFTLQD